MTFGLIAITEIVLLGVMSGALWGLISYGMAISWAVLNVIQFSYGDFVVYSGLGAFTLFSVLHFDPLISLVVIVPLFFVAGLGLGRVLLHYQASGSFHASFMITLGISYLMLGIATRVWGPYQTSILTSYVDAAVTLGPVHIAATVVETFAVATVCGIFIYFMVSKTGFGIATRALAENKPVSSILGVNIFRTGSLAFAVGLSFTAIGGALLPLTIPIAPISDQTVLFISFTVSAMVLVARNLMFAYLGGIVIGLGETLAPLVVPAGFSAAVPPLVLVIILLYIGGRRRQL